MPKSPVLSGKRLIKALQEIGYVVVRQKGSHIRLHHTSRKEITVPNHKIIGRGLLRKILRDTELSVVELISLL